MESVLESIKKPLGIPQDATHFDADLIMHINSAFLTLAQIGVRGERLFQITGSDEEWSEFLADDKSDILAYARLFVFYKTRMMFDPPSNSFVMDAITKEIDELEWRMRHALEIETAMTG